MGFSITIELRGVWYLRYCYVIILTRLVTGVSPGVNLTLLAQPGRVGIALVSFFWQHAFFQGRSQPHSPGWARVSLSSSFAKILINFFLFFLKLDSFSSSFWPSGWASRPPGKALATPLPFSHTFLHLILTKLEHVDQYLDHYSDTKMMGSEVMMGVTGVKNIYQLKNMKSTPI